MVRHSVRLVKVMFWKNAKNHLQKIAQRKLERKTMSRRTETAYKAWSPGKPAQHVEAQDSGDRVNAVVV